MEFGPQILYGFFNTNPSDRWPPFAFSRLRFAARAQSNRCSSESGVAISKSRFGCHPGTVQIVFGCACGRKCWSTLELWPCMSSEREALSLRIRWHNRQRHAGIRSMACRTKLKHNAEPGEGLSLWTNRRKSSTLTTRNFLRTITTREVLVQAHTANNGQPLSDSLHSSVCHDYRGRWAKRNNAAASE